MSISCNLGQLNYERNQEWHLPFSKDNARQAIYTFNGDVYRAMDANTIEDVKGFNYEGYGFSKTMSSETELVFIR